MRDPDRIDPMIEELRALWKKNPDMRLGQLFYNVYLHGHITKHGSFTESNIFYIEDDSIQEYLENTRGGWVRD